MGRAKRLLAVRGDVVRLRLRPDLHTWRTGFYGCAAIVGLGTVLGLLLVDGAAWGGVLVGLILLAVGFLVGLPDRETRLDWGARLMLGGKGDTKAGATPFARLAAVVAEVRIDVISTGPSKYEVRRFLLGFLVADEAEPLSQMLRALRRERGALVSRGEPVLDEDQPRLARVMQGALTTVVACTDETAVWQASEWLAKKLDLPLIDACTSPTVLRVPEELDLPLGERLALGAQHIDEVSESTAASTRLLAPPGASVESEQGMCTLTWRNNQHFEVLCGLALLFSALGLILFPDRGAGFWTLETVGLSSLLLAVGAARWHGLNRLTLDRDQLRVTRGPFARQLPPLATDRIEAVRVGGTSANPLLGLVADERVLRILADERVLRIPMSPPLARWAKRNIERHLRDLYEKRSMRANAYR